MGAWIVTLKGDEHDLRELSQVLKDGAIRIIGKDGSYTLETDAFLITDTANDIRRKAKDALNTISGVAYVLLDARCPIELGGIAQLQDDGKRIVHVGAKQKITFRDSLSITVRDAEGEIVREIRPAGPALKWLEVADQHECVRRVLRVLAAPDLLWGKLNNVYEIIKDDVGGDKKIANLEWSTMQTLKRFRRTANHPESAGDDARHGVSKKQPPANPMPISEARNMIKMLVHCWIASKA